MVFGRPHRGGRWRVGRSGRFFTRDRGRGPALTAELNWGSELSPNVLLMWGWGRVPGWLLLLTIGVSAAAEPLEANPNGFSLESARIPVEDILRGGPPRDGIPALTDPAVLTAAEAPWADEARVIGVEIDGEARAYPLAILNWHELVNDSLGGTPILVSYCPLCGTGMVFDREVAGVPRHFGVSGLLYRSDLLLYDRESESLWSQIAATAVTGPASGQRLRLLRSRQQSWKHWREAHPDTSVLSPATGHVRNYSRSPYGDYERNDRLYFPVPLDSRYAPKVQTLGIRLPDGRARAYPAPEVIAAGGIVREVFAGLEIEVRYDARRVEFEVRAPDSVAIVEGYWFAWLAFHPDSSVFVAEPLALK